MMWAILCFLLLSSNSSATIQLTDFGAIANDGIDDGPALQQALKVAYSNNATIRIPKGVFDFNPQVIRIPRDFWLRLEGASQEGTVLRRMQPSSWTMRFRARNGASLSLRNLTLCGNATELGRVREDDQLHELRVDALGEQMRLVELENVGSLDLMSDGVQLVHNGLELVRCTGWKHFGGSKGRRCFQASYHPKRAVVRDCQFVDFSTEPAGGSRNRCNLEMRDCVITGTANLQQLGESLLTNLQIQHLSNVTPLGGEFSNSSVRTVGSPTFYRECRVTLRNVVFHFQDKNPICAWARREGHRQKIHFESCVFQPADKVPTLFRTLTPDRNQRPSSSIRFRNCVFPGCDNAALSLNQGYSYDIKSCVFQAAETGIQCNARLAIGAKLVERDNLFLTNKSIRAIQTSSNAFPFRISVQATTKERMEIDETSPYRVKEIPVSPTRGERIDRNSDAN